MSILTESKRVEIGNRINNLIAAISAKKNEMTNLENQLADLRKTVAEDAVNFTEADLIEVDATSEMKAISAKLMPVGEISTEKIL